MSALDVAAEHARARSRLAEEVRQEAGGLWARVDPDRISESWARQMPRLMLRLIGAQRAAASGADTYLTEVLAAQGINPAASGRLAVGSLMGMASDGRPLVSLLAEPGIVTKVALLRGATIDRAMAAGGALAELVAHTQVADAGRVADGVALVARPHAGGYVRMVVGETCSRCLILAGRKYEWNAGFRRHPKCDCIHIPTDESDRSDLRVNPRKSFDAMTAAEQDRVFGKASAQAIRDGADMARVVNARRGMYTAADARLYTTELVGPRPRLMPEQILRDATDRDDAIRLLRLHGYITS